MLKRISLAVAGGEFVALLGPSGCGKTTLLRAISGFVPVASGRVAVAGREITHEPPDRRGMAMVFQSYALWPHMTTAQNLGYGLKLRRIAKPEIARRVADILTMLKLEGFGERNVTQLSGGQRQRVALGRALAVNPEVLLLDEPLSNLDARIREDVRHEIKAVQAKLGITTIHVTHDREEAMVMADRIAILDAGRIAQPGAPEEVYNRPNSPFIASFMGAGNPRVRARRAGCHHPAAADVYRQHRRQLSDCRHYRADSADPFGGVHAGHRALSQSRRVVQGRRIIAFPGGNSMDATTTEQLMAQLRAVAREAEELLQATADQTGEQIEELRERAKASLAAAREIDAQVRKNPWAAVAIAAGVGLLLGLLLARK